MAQRLRKEKLCGGTVKIKLRWADFSTITRQVTLTQPSDLDEEIIQAAQRLFDKAYTAGQSVRLLGVGVSNLQSPARQLSLWETTSTEQHKLQAAIDNVRNRYGERIIQRGSELKSSRRNHDETNKII